MLFSSLFICSTTHFVTTLATTTNSSHVKATGSCELRDYWRKELETPSFDPTQDCLGLNKVLANFDQYRTFNLCTADPDVVSKYINSSLSNLRASLRTRPCELRQWFYGNYGGKLREPFCQNATEIAVGVETSHNFRPAHTQPYSTVFHGARTLCMRKFKSDLRSIGDPDLAGIGVLISQVMGMLLLYFFLLAALWPETFPFATSFLNAIRRFYVTATVLSFSIATAALVTFWYRRSKSESLHANFGHVNFYVNLMLALAPPLSVLPAVVLVMMPPKVRNKGNGKEMETWDRLAMTMLYTFCIVVMWIIWSVGIRGQQNPTRIMFGGSRNVRVSRFIYEHASTYILLVCILMSAFPVAVLAALVALLISHGVGNINVERRDRSLSFLRDRCRDLSFFFGISQLVMFAYIRGQAIEQADGVTSETHLGFGQILILFTWLPLLLSIGSGVAYAIRNRLRHSPWLGRTNCEPQIGQHLLSESCGPFAVINQPLPLQHLQQTLSRSNELS